MAVVGVPDPQWGEVGHAFVVRAKGAAVSTEELTEHCHTHLATFKAPRTITSVDPRPRNAAALRHEEARP
ncbi:MAG: AMP-binding enzyme [Georgenia sp.]